MDKHCAGFNLAFKEESRKASEETEHPKELTKGLAVSTLIQRFTRKKQHLFFHLLEKGHGQSQIQTSRIKSFLTRLKDFSLSFFH